jgi:pimeloyl-ACP methyl ester carboxylesterase
MRRLLRLAATGAMACVLGACAPTPGSSMPVPEDVSFPSLDGGVVSAALHGTGARGVVLVHGGRFDRTSWAPQAPVLARAGFRVLAIDLRGRGGSGGGRAGADSVHLDVLGAVRYLRETGATSIALVGASFGGWAAAEAVRAAEPGEIDRVVLLAHAPVDRPEELTARKLFLVARGDTSGAGVSRLAATRNQFHRAPEPKELIVLEGAAHAQFLFETDEADRLLREILRFLSDPANPR